MNPSIVATDDGLKALALAVARNRLGPNDPIEDVLLVEGIAPEDFTKIVDDPVFKRYVRLFTKELTDNGLSFKMKSRVLVEDLISHMFAIVGDRDQPASARIKAFETLAKYGGYDDEMAAEARKLNQLSIDGTPAFQIVFNIPTLPPTHVNAAIPDPRAPAAIPATFDVDFSMVKNAPTVARDKEDAALVPLHMELEAEADAYEYETDKPPIAHAA